MKLYDKTRRKLTKKVISERLVSSSQIVERFLKDRYHPPVYEVIFRRASPCVVVCWNRFIDISKSHRKELLVEDDKDDRTTVITQFSEDWNSGWFFINKRDAIAYSKRLEYFRLQGIYLLGRWSPPSAHILIKTLKEHK